MFLSEVIGTAGIEDMMRHAHYNTRSRDTLLSSAKALISKAKNISVRQRQAFRLYSHYTIFLKKVIQRRAEIQVQQT